MKEKQRAIGDRVDVTAGNYGGEATIIDTRPSDNALAPASHYKVRMKDDGQEFWAYDYEISEL